MARSTLIYQPPYCTSLLRQVDKSVTVIKRMGKFDWCAVIEKQWCNFWKRQNVLSLQGPPPKCAWAKSEGLGTCAF